MYQRIGDRRPELYGIMGRKRHGKDTFAKAVVAAAQAMHKPSACEITHFADPLKAMAQTLFGLTWEQLHDDNLKESVLPVPIVLDLYVNAMRAVTGLPNIEAAALVASTPRQVAQFFGTEYVRRAQDDYWIHRTIDNLRTGTSRARRRVLIPDTRFPNEVTAIRAAGGKIITVVRIDALPSTDGHSSESLIDTIEPDLLLGVRTGDLALVERAAKLIAWNKFDRAKSLDYRIVKPALEAYAGGASAEDAAAILGHRSASTMYFLAGYYGMSTRARPSRQRVAHELRDNKEHKWCSKCSTWKPLREFNVCFNAWDKLSGWCRGCAAVGNQAYDYSLRGMYERVRRGAGQRRKRWSLTFDDFEAMWTRQNGRCAYTGQGMTLVPKDPNKVSIDRVNSADDYTPQNVVLCTARVNLMKREMTVDEFVTVCAAVAAWQRDGVRLSRNIDRVLGTGPKEDF